jgi:1-acyl-sn-glycerol-3-phosphate acyltransferase
MSKKHNFFFKLLKYPVILFLKLKFNYKYKTVKDLPENYIVLSNHATDYDPLLVACTFKKQMYFVASEHITRWGFAYKLLKLVFDPIIRYKGTVAASTAMSVIRKTKKGGNVCIFAEGVRTWDGVTCPIHPSTAKMVRAAKCGLVTFKLTGGYFSSPMWSNSSKTRRGKLYGAPVNVYTKEQIAEMNDEELLTIIEKDLHEDAYETQIEAQQIYKGKRLAEGLERFLFSCPSCLAHNSFESKNDTVKCNKCGFSFTYNKKGFLEGAPYDTVKDFAAWQKTVVEDDINNGRIYEEDDVKIFAIVNHESELLSQGKLTISQSEIRCGDIVIPTDSIPEMAMHGKQALVFSTKDNYYEISPQNDTNMIRFYWYFNTVKANQKIEA